MPHFAIQVKLSPSDRKSAKTEERDASANLSL